MDEDLIAMAAFTAERLDDAEAATPHLRPQIEVRRARLRLLVDALNDHNSYDLATTLIPWEAAEYATHGDYQPQWGEPCRLSLRPVRTEIHERDWPMSEGSTHISPGSITTQRIAEGAIQTGDILEELRNGNPETVEALFIVALSRMVGHDEARRVLGDYKQRIVPAAVERKSKWPSAEELQKAADIKRATGNADDAVLADWLEATSNALAWLAPFRDHEPGYGMWQAASAYAQLVNRED